LQTGQFKALEDTFAAAKCLIQLCSQNDNMVVAGVCAN